VRPSVPFVKLPRIRFKRTLTLLVVGGLVACTCAALDLDFSHLMHSLLRVVGMQAPASTGRFAGEFLLDAGEQLTVTGRSLTISRLSSEAVSTRLAWAGTSEKWLAFQGESLESVAAVFNRYNARKLVIGEPGTGKLQIGGKFRVNDLDTFVAALGLTHGVKATLSAPVASGVDDIITLSGGTDVPQAPANTADIDPQDPAGSAGPTGLAGSADRRDPTSQTEQASK